MNPNLQKLQTYPFEKLANLKSGVNPSDQLTHIALSIGEPKHKAPACVIEELANQLTKNENYAATRGSPEFRETICKWLQKRFNLKTCILDADKHILPVNGTREALFAFSQAVVDPSNNSAKVLFPNPFYQIYEGACFLAGAEPVYLNCNTENLIPDFDSVTTEDWEACQLLYLCSPGNPTGAILSIKDYEKLFKLADEQDFVIAADECYSELYFDENTPPLGILEACEILGRKDYSRCITFHSLSKRSNLPGLRSGFVAGDEELVSQFYKYRTYHGCAMSLPIQHASIAAWSDEKHVLKNRDLYREKFSIFFDILKNVTDLKMPEAGFYVWLKTPYDDQEFTRDLYAQKNITVLPGSFLARDTENGNPGKNYVRIALVATIDEITEAANRVKDFLGNVERRSAG